MSGRTGAFSNFARAAFTQHAKRMERMKYKALFLDIDDTLIGNDRTISPGNLAAIRRAQATGIFVTIATGRGYLGSAARSSYMAGR